MAEIFKPRENMVYKGSQWVCQDENGQYVCVGGPSLIWDDGREWNFYTTVYGYHRLDGPAASDGEWYLNNTNVTKDIKAFAKENDIDLENLTDEDKVMIALRFG